MENDDAFELSLEVAEIPRGGDSPTERYDVDVVASEVRYLGPVGRGRRGNYERSFVPFDLTAQQRERLADVIEGYDLRQSVEETFAPDSSGPFFDEIDASATLTVDGEEYELRIEGAMYHAGAPTGMAHHEQAEGLRTLCEAFESWADAVREDSSW